ILMKAFRRSGVCARKAPFGTVRAAQHERRRAPADTIRCLSPTPPSETKARPQPPLEGERGEHGRVPERPTLEGLEAKWSAVWEREDAYRFDREAPRERVFSIDTPPPTVS